MEQKYETGVCVLCGDDFRAGCWEPTRSRMIENQHCFGCNFWSGFVATIDNPTHLVIEGKHYVVGREDQSGSDQGRGFGGAYFSIVTDDGRTIETTNLWHQGTVPGHFRHVLADNARWAAEEAAA
ncbi:hypothetical protein LCGC14_2477900 [marine sediment metagenome]|uniref:Uncharacterized protein n=1 Tax=marine sediment metagenome TaxID=412755 RepID=A0A0F9B9A6_9ZZZZ